MAIDKPGNVTVDDAISSWSHFKEDRVRQHIDRRIVCDDLAILNNVEGVGGVQTRSSLRKLCRSLEVPLNFGADRPVKSEKSPSASLCLRGGNQPDNWLLCRGVFVHT